MSAGSPGFAWVGFKYFKSASEERTGVYGCYIILIKEKLLMEKQYTIIALKSHYSLNTNSKSNYTWHSCPEHVFNKHISSMLFAIIHIRLINNENAKTYKY